MNRVYLYIFFALLIVFSFVFFSQKIIIKKSSVKKAEKDSLILIDSMKWCFYTFNFGDSALFYDSSKQRVVSIPVVECDADIDEILKFKDSIRYYFTFLREHSRFKYTNAINAIGVYLTNKTIYPITPHIKFDFTNSTDSMRNYLSERTDIFYMYLHNYKGRISGWLKQEAIKRKIDVQ